MHTRQRCLLILALAVLTPRASFASCELKPALEFQAGTRPTSMAVADFNGDGRADLAMTVRMSATVLIFMGNGDGTFAPPLSVPTRNIGSPVAAADLNGDGKADLAVSDWTANAIAILLGNGDGTFSAPTSFPVGLTPNSILAADLDRDGTRDLAVANVNSDNVSVLLGTGTGAFKPATHFATGRNPQQIALGDFDRNGVPDLAAANRGAGTVSILMGDGAGAFAPAVTIQIGPASSLPYALAVGDFNGDGVADLAVPRQAQLDVMILLGRSDGTFSPGDRHATGNFSSFVVVGDFNRDGKEDLALDGNDIALLIGNGDGTFKPVAHVGPSADSLAVADLDGNGQPDLAGVDEFANQAWAMLGSCSRRRAVRQ